jgi:undecaprenyl-diphosphatase
MTNTLLIETIQQFRSSFFDSLFIVLNFFDTFSFFLILIPALWFSKGWKIGTRFYSILFLQSLIIDVLKKSLILPRPFHLDPNLGVIKVSGYGFPSGAASSAMLFSALLATYWKSPLKWALIIPYFTLLSLSRMYLGVHFLEDVIAGWGIGIFSWAIFVYIFPKIETWLNKKSLYTNFSLSLLLPLLTMTIFPSSSTNISIIAIGLSIGVFTNLIFKTPYTSPKTFKNAVLNGVIGVLLIGILSFILKPLTLSSPLLSLLILTLSVSFLGSFINIKTKSLNQ